MWGSRQKLAEQTNVSASFITLWLKGERRPSWETSKVLSEILGVEQVDVVESGPDRRQDIFDTWAKKDKG